ncbi:MAG TPA: aminodeoxychorismate lyase, partial [Gammaproteobacteria bacterium]|nr:aminodeoxychorismate lyase [Gammaproteobacteria bacterium]
MEPLWLVNGQRTGVDPSDRGLAYGDGLFETMGCVNGTIRWLDHHLERLVDGCARLAIPAPDTSEIRAELRAHCPRDGRAVAKLIVTRGPGARGYGPPPRSKPTRILAISAWPSYPRENYSAGISVGVCELRLAEAPRLAGLKHLCRLEQVLAELELGNRAQQGLLLDASGRVIGGTRSNVFAVRDGRLLTPALDRCGIRGVMRRVVLETAGTAGLVTEERDLTLGDLHSAAELFMTNSLFGIWPVARLDERPFAPGPMTRELMRRL